MAMTGRYDEARSAMAEARAGLAELQLGVIAAYLALLDGDRRDAGRATRRRRSAPSATPRRWSPASETRWYLAFIYVDLAHAILAQGRVDEAAAAVARIETLPAPCDAEWAIKRHTARALLAAPRRRPRARARGRARGRRGRRRHRPADLPRQRPPHARRAAARDCGRPEEAAASALRALALDEAKGNTVAAASTRRRFADVL